MDNESTSTTAKELGDGEFLARWLAAWREADEEMGLGPEHHRVRERVGVGFLAYLRSMSRFGVFQVGPITIQIDMVEEAVARDIALGKHDSDGSDLNRLIHLVQKEQQKAGKRNADELHVLLAFMRFGSGVPGRVFGELGVTPEQVEHFVRTGGAGVAEVTPEPMYTPEEAAAYLKVHVETVREWIRTGRLRAGRLAAQRALRIRASDLMSVWEPLKVDSEE